MAVYNYSKNKYDLSLPLKFIIFFYTLSPFLYLARTIAGDEGAVSALLRIMEPMLIVIVTFSIIKTGSWRLPKYSVLLVLLAIYGFLIGILQGNEVINVVAGLSHFVAGIIIFTYFYLTDVRNQMHKFMRLLSMFTIISNSMVLAIIYSAPKLFGINIYLGLASQVLIVVFFLIFIKGNCCIRLSH